MCCESEKVVLPTSSLHVSRVRFLSEPRLVHAVGLQDIHAEGL